MAVLVHAMRPDGGAGRVRPDHADARVRGPREHWVVVAVAVAVGVAVVVGVGVGVVVVVGVVVAVVVKAIINVQLVL